MVMDMHMHYDKTHARQELTYIKYVGFFILAFYGFMMMEEESLIGNYLIAVNCTGFWFLFASVMATLFISSEIDWKRSIYEQEEKALEERYPSIINFSYFKMISKLNTARYRATLLARLTSFTSLGGMIIWSAVMLALKTSSNLAITVGVGSSIVLVATMIFLARNKSMSKK